MEWNDGGARALGVRVLVCRECPRVSSFSARGWKAYRVDDPARGGRPRIAFSCPDCAVRDSTAPGQ